MKINFSQEVDLFGIAQALRADSLNMAQLLTELHLLDEGVGQAKALGNRIGRHTGQTNAEAITAYLRELADGIAEGALPRWPKA